MVATIPYIGLKTYLFISEEIKMLKMKKLAGTAVTLAFLVSGCSTASAPGQSGTPAPGQSPVAGKQAQGSESFTNKELGGLKFGKVSAQNANLLNNQQGNQASLNPIAPQAGTTGNAAASRSASAPAPAVAPAAEGGTSGGVAAGGGTSGGPTGATADIAIAPAAKYGGGVAYPGYFPAPGMFEEYVMVAFEEAKSDGFTGTFLDAYSKKVKPVIAEWSSDARLTNTYGSTDDQGQNKVPSGVQEPNYQYYYSPYQWQFTYVSASKKEIYSFMISPKETLVLRQKWALKDINSDDVKIDSNAAIKLYMDKVKDKSYTSPDNQEQYYRGPNQEILYSVPEKGSWYFYLNQEPGALVWNINVNFNYNDGVMPPVPLAATTDVAVSSGGTASSAGSAPSSSASASPNFTKPQPVTRTYYSGGYARINAKTGEILSMARPVKYTETYYPYPYPYPAKCDGQGNCYSEGSSGGTAPAGAVTTVDAPPPPPSTPASAPAPAKVY